MSGSAEPAGLMEAFWAYERALMSDNIPVLDRLFAPGPRTLRGDAHGLLVGHAAISEFRNLRGGAVQRRIVETHVRAIDDDHALIVAITELHSGGRGQQTQLWERQLGLWVVTAAHVSVRATAFDRRVWRVVGDPLVEPTGSGLLDGQTIAVKDLFAVAGQRVGAGNPAWLAQARTETTHATAVEGLLAAGASIKGIARTDEFAYSLAGINEHYGLPPNPKAPHRLSGGSSSGSASAVSLGHATIGLGTDTGGSIRVPAAYQGLWGIRTTHGTVSTHGLLPLAPSFDAVGWMTRDIDLLSAVGATLLPPDREAIGELVVVDDLLALADPDVSAVLVPACAELPRWDSGFHVPDTWLQAFQTLQAWEAWQAHGEWLAGRLDTLGDDVRARFVQASKVDEVWARRAREQVIELRTHIRSALGQRVLVMPSAASVAPRIADPDQFLAVRQATMRLTCVAGIGGLPAVNVPLATDAGLPVGLCLVGPAGSDLALLDLARALA